MYPRPFMLKEEPLKILLDSHSVDRVLPSSNRRINALLKYDGVKFLELLRSPESVKNKKLQEIVEFHRKLRSNGSLHSFEITKGKYTSKHAFAYRRDDVEKIGKLVFQEDDLDIDESQATELVFVQANLNQRDGLNIMVTENDVILRNRLWFESHFPGGSLNIMTIEEAAEVADLVLKRNGEYPISDHFSVNKGYWYWLSFRTKVPYYNVTKSATPLEKTILESLAQRFVFLLMSVDEIGFQYYSGVNNDTMESMIYHFNYFISLVSGIFDSLALQTFKQYKLVFDGSHIPSRISLHKKAGKDFLKAVRKANPNLRKHINNFVHFINAVYILRQRVLHREGLRETGFGHSDGWQANLIKVPSNFIKCVGHCGDQKVSYQPWTRFGAYANAFLEPYSFAKSAALLLSEFCSKYLQLLGFTNFIDEIKRNRPGDDFVQTLSLFETDNLGL